MSISLQEFQRRYAAIREKMAEEEIDSILVYGLADDFNRGNMRYLTGSGRGGCCILPMEDPPVFFTGLGQSKSPKLRNTVGALDLLDIRETDDTINQVLVEISRLDRGNKTGIVGSGCMPPIMYITLKEKLGKKWTDSTGIFERMREVKSAEEIDNARRSAAIADIVYRMLREMIKPGLSEYEIYGAVKKKTYEMGCEYSFDLIDAAGTTMNMSFFPTVDRLEENGTLFMEITPAYSGYYAQLPVTLPVMSYPAKVEEMVKAWERADRAVREFLKPGTKVSDIYRVLIDSVRESGFISPYRPGHSIGLDALDFWSITGDNHRLLEPGMVLAVHPSVMLEMGGDACGMGYTYLINDTGAERFSKIDLAAELIGN
jgi:Xaa-Pro aminopeptidase